jgi:DNA-binding NtrC family response regulator
MDNKDILIVDDDRATLQILSRILQKQGYTTETAETGREAEEKINGREHDLALIDVRLPDTDGLELMNKIHAIRPKMVMILMTGFPSMDNGIKAIDSGADAYLVKPVLTQELLKVIEEKLKNKERP